MVEGPTTPPRAERDQSQASGPQEEEEESGESEATSEVLEGFQCRSAWLPSLGQPLRKTPRRWKKSVAETVGEGVSPVSLWSEGGLSKRSVLDIVVVQSTSVTTGPWQTRVFLLIGP